MTPRRRSTRYKDQASSSDDESHPETDMKSSASVTRHMVTHHDYHDRSTEKQCANGTGINKYAADTRIFPVKLYDMLQCAEEVGIDHAISWQPHGRCFVVHDPKAFCSIMPNFFSFTKIASFQRQLNLYGFQRLTRGRDKNGYYNELFLRGRPDLMGKLVRVKVKGTKVRAKANPSEEPNLYSYSFMEVNTDTILPKKRSCAWIDPLPSVITPLSPPKKKKSVPLNLCTPTLKEPSFPNEIPLDVEDMMELDIEEVNFFDDGGLLMDRTFSTTDETAEFVEFLNQAATLL